MRSFLVANRIFVYWLDSRSSEQSLLMEQIYKTFPPLAVHLGWFIDESSGVKLTSIAAMPVLATDFFSNLEVWTSIPAATSIAQPKRDVAVGPAATTDSLDSSRVYISFTFSDGDNLQYIQHRMLGRWQESGHDGSRFAIYHRRTDCFSESSVRRICWGRWFLNVNGRVRHGRKVQAAH